MDIISYVMGMNAGKKSAGGGGSGGGQYYNGITTLTGTWDERVSVDFGFVPDFILVHAYENVSISDKNFLIYAGSANYPIPARVYYVYSSTMKRSTATNAYITSTDGPINSADETGFNLGISHFSGKATVIAFKFA